MHPLLLAVGPVAGPSAWVAVPAWPLLTTPPGT